MPGVPSGRGCEACRKQKKKCDQAQPICSRCARLGLECIGAGQQRYKFINQQAFRNSTPENRIINRRRSPLESSNVYIVYKAPSNELDLLLHAFVVAVQPSTDLRYNLAWAYGAYLEDVPRRLGTNEALDAAATAAIIAHSTHCAGRRVTVDGLAKYSEGLNKLRLCLDDPVKASSSETLCAVNLLLLCQSLMGLWEGSNSTGHCEGMAHMIRARGYSPQNSFESKLLASMRGSVIFTGLVSDKVQLTVKEWKSLAYNPTDGDTYGGKLMRSLCLVPYLTGRRMNNKPETTEHLEVLEEIRAGYQTLKPVIDELKCRLADVVLEPASNGIIQADAQILRMYGLSLAIAIIIGCVLVVFTSDNQQLISDMESHSEDILIVSELSKEYKPLGASYVPICLWTAWIGTSNCATKQTIKNALKDFYQHPSYSHVAQVSIREIDSGKQWFRVLRPDPAHNGVKKQCSC